MDVHFDPLQRAIEAAERFQNNMNPAYDTGHILQATMYALIALAAGQRANHELYAADAEKKARQIDDLIKSLIEY